jgi:DNA-binding beta-propeller fold protein YncE
VIESESLEDPLTLEFAPINHFNHMTSVRIIYHFFIIVAPAIGTGLTVAGYCNASGGNGINQLQGPWGIYVSPLDEVLYVTECDIGRFRTFLPFSRVIHTSSTSGLAAPNAVFVDSSSTTYISDGGISNGIVYIQRAGVTVRSFPAIGLSTSSCLLTGLDGAYGIAVDRSGNIYISLYWCFVVVKWAPNATSGTVAAGVSGSQGSSSTNFYSLRFIHLDEDRGMLYVCDNGNHRIQRFTIGGNGVGVTVAGTGTHGTGLNQLNNPSGIRVTSDGQTLYIADYGNNRVMKWTIGATQGSLVAGSLSGTAGKTSQLLNGPGDVAFDPTETYLYVSDYGNNRVQKFRIQ